MKLLLILIALTLLASDNFSKLEKVAQHGNVAIYKFHDGPVTCYVMEEHYTTHIGPAISCVREAR